MADVPLAQMDLGALVDEWLDWHAAADLLEDVLAIRTAKGRHTPPAAGMMTADEGARARGTRDDGAGASRGRAREAAVAKFCWQCRKPLHARTDRCPFCGETQ